MTKADLEWDIESRCRIAMNYAGYRYTFFKWLNIILCILSIASLWCSGFVYAGTEPGKSCVLNVVGSVMLIVDVVLNLLGCNGFWKSMLDGYGELYSEFVGIRSAASVQELEAFKSRFTKFDCRCNAEYNALGLIAWNDACAQMGKSNCVKPVPLYKRLTANLFAWGSVADNFK